MFVLKQRCNQTGKTVDVVVHAVREPGVFVGAVGRLGAASVPAAVTGGGGEARMLSPVKVIDDTKQ